MKRIEVFISEVSAERMEQIADSPAAGGSSRLARTARRRTTPEVKWRQRGR